MFQKFQEPLLVKEGRQGRAKCSLLCICGMGTLSVFNIEMCHLSELFCSNRTCLQSAMSHLCILDEWFFNVRAITRLVFMHLWRRIIKKATNGVVNKTERIRCFRGHSATFPGNVRQIYVNSHGSDSPWPTAQVPCCPATIQLITCSQKVAQLQLKPKEGSGFAAFNIIQHILSSYCKFWMNTGRSEETKLLPFPPIRKVQAPSKYVSVTVLRWK